MEPISSVIVKTLNIGLMLSLTYDADRPMR
jgi:hypothetical protein